MLMVVVCARNNTASMHLIRCGLGLDLDIRLELQFIDVHVPWSGLLKMI